MNINVEPKHPRLTHHLSLSDGVDSVGLILCDSEGNALAQSITRVPTPRTAMKTTTGNQKYSDYEPPWSPVAQEDWSGGRGQEDFDLDVTRYSDSLNINTIYKQLFLQGQPTLTRGYRKQIFDLPGNLQWIGITSGITNYVAVNFTTDQSYDISYIELWVKRNGDPEDDLIVELCDNDGNKPSLIPLQSDSISTSDITDTVGTLWRFDIVESLDTSTSYWIKIYSDNGNDFHHWSIGTNPTGSNSKCSSDGASWSTALFDIYYRLMEADINCRTKFFSYKRCQYAIYNNTTSAPKVYINGDRGVADSNTGHLDELIDASKTWTAGEWTGCVVVLIGGKGSNEPQPWRKILSNDSTYLTVDKSWLIEHDTTTEYVIIASDKWTEVTSHGLTADVTSVLVINNICYFAQGDSVNIRRMRWYNNAGTSTYEWADDGTNKATFLCVVRDDTTGLNKIWRANNLDSNSKKSVSSADVKDWNTNLTFGTPIEFNDPHGLITNIMAYGEESENYLWVFREGSIFAIVDGKPDEIPLKEMHSDAEYTNGRTALTHNVYMWFNYADGLEKYYNRTLDDVGPNRDDGLPLDRQGPILCLAGCPGQVYAAVDAGDDGYSSILYKREGEKGVGWCELYRSLIKGIRIWDMAFQPIPGPTINRLWVGVGNDLIWLPVTAGGKKPTQELNYQYIHEGAIELGYMYVGMYDINKFFHSLKLFTENLSEDECWVEADYRIDSSTEWVPVPESYTISPMQENKLVNEYGINGKRIQIRLRLFTTDNTITPIIKGIVVENVSRVPVKYSFTFTFRNYDNDVNLLGEKEEASVENKQYLLDKWANNLTPLVMRSNRLLYDNRVVFIDPAQLQTIRTSSEGYIEKMNVVEI